jgi:undecaprenyl-diphosphatase
VHGSRARLWSGGDAAWVGALLVGAGTGRGRGRELDVRLFRFLNRDRGPVADASMDTITELGSIWASAGAAAVVATVGGRRREALDAMGAALAMWTLGQVLKRVFDRPRPYQSARDQRLLIAEPRGRSWPSSHPAVLMTFGSVLARDLGGPRKLRRGLAALAGAVGLSRVYVGVHYPADVAGGLLLGCGVADLWGAMVSPRVVGRAPVQ